MSDPHDARTDRRAALAGGACYLLTFAASFPAVALLRPILEDPGYVTGVGADGRVLAGCVLDLVNALACIGTAVALYPLVRRRAPGRAIGFVASRLFEAAVIAVGVVALLAVVTLRRDVGGAGVVDPSLATVARALVAVRDWTFLLGPGLMAPINAALLAGALLRSGLVPRLIPRLGLIGAPLLLTNTLVTLFRGNEALVAFAAVAVAPIVVWEFSLGLWLTFRGVRRGAGVAIAGPAAAVAA